MKKLVVLSSIMVPSSIFAQAGASAPLLLEGANFFVCIIAGVLLAIGFQLLLTMLSVAGGITAIGNVKKSANKSHSSSSNSHKEKDEGGMNLGQKISTGLGTWTLITTSIALFFASLLAVKLGLVAANFIGATLGLVIWATFFILMTYLEMNMVSSLVGGMISTVKNSLSSASSVFSKSEESVSKEVARTKAKAESKEMRKEFEKLFSRHDIDKKIDDYVRKLEPQKINIKDLKKQAKDLITDLQVTEKADYDYPNSVKKMILEEADKSTLSKEDKQALKEHVNGLKDIAGKDVSNQEKAKQGLQELTPADREQINKYQDQIKKALQSTHKDELQPEKLEQDLKRIFEHPGEASNVVKTKASAMDRDTLIKIATSQGVQEEKAQQYADKIEGVLQKLSSSFGSASSQSSAKKADLQAKIKGMFSGAGSSFDLNKIESDFSSIFQSSAGEPGLKYKLEHYDRAQMTALISSKTSFGREKSETVADKIVSARDGVLQKADELEQKVNQKMEEAKQKSLQAAEESREAAVTAAWWLVATAICSGVASAVGGIIALEEWFMF